MTLARMKPRSKSLWILPAACGALVPLRMVHARHSFLPSVRKECYLQRFCTVEVTDAAQKLRRITFQGEVLLDGHFWEADGFVLHIENRRPVLIHTIFAAKKAPA